MAFVGIAGGGRVVWLAWLARAGNGRASRFGMARGKPRARRCGRAIIERIQCRPRPYDLLWCGSQNELRQLSTLSLPFS